MITVKLDILKRNPDCGFLCLILNQDGHRIVIRTFYVLSKMEWIEKDGYISLNGSLMRESERLQYINKVINRKKKELKKMGSNFPLPEVEERYYGVCLSSSYFVENAEGYIGLLRLQKRTSTAMNHKASVYSLLSYKDVYSMKTSDMSLSLIKMYESYLGSRNICRNTISFYMRNLRSIYNKGMENKNLPTQNIFKDVYTGIDKTVKKAIPLDFVKKIKEIDLGQNPELELARDLFMFSFYTRGMSYIDMAYLRRENIRNGQLVYYRHKTKQKIEIKWENEMKDIVDRYAGKSKYLLPIISDSNTDVYKQYKNSLIITNRKLKRISEITGLHINISTYTARHSWASIARKINVPLSVISKGLGHDSDLNTQIYLDSIKTDEVDKANRKIIGKLV